MTNKQMAPKVQSWLKSTDVEPEDVRRSVGIVSSRVQQTRQRGRWWPAPTIRRQADPRAVGTDRRSPSLSIPASYGHSPTVIWRTQTMLSPAKAIIAGAIVALFGGLLASGTLVPAAPSAVTPGADAPMAATDAVPLQENEFEGSLIIGGVPASSYAPEDSVPGVIRYHYMVNDMSEPRLDGDWVLSYTQSLVDFGASRHFLYHASFRMEDEEGAWQEAPNYTLELPGGTASSRTSLLVGEGAYEGLTAVTELTYVPQGKFDIHGVITDEPIPVAPVHVPTDQ